MSEESKPVVVTLVKDLFFSVKLSNQIRAADFSAKVVKTSDAFEEAVKQQNVTLGVVDLGARLDRSTLVRLSEAARAANVPVIAFGPHKDVDALRDAQAAGFTRVLSNGVFHAQTVEMIHRYARHAGDDAAL